MGLYLNKITEKNHEFSIYKSTMLFPGILWEMLSYRMLGTVSFTGDTWSLAEEHSSGRWEGLTQASFLLENDACQFQAFQLDL